MARYNMAVAGRKSKFKSKIQIRTFEFKDGSSKSKFRKFLRRETFYREDYLTLKKSTKIILCVIMVIVYYAFVLFLEHKKVTMYGGGDIVALIGLIYCCKHIGSFKKSLYKKLQKYSIVLICVGFIGCYFYSIYTALEGKDYPLPVAIIPPILYVIMCAAIESTLPNRK